MLVRLTICLTFSRQGSCYVEIFLIGSGHRHLKSLIEVFETETLSWQHHSRHIDNDVILDIFCITWTLRLQTAQRFAHIYGPR